MKVPALRVPGPWGLGVTMGAAAMSRPREPRQAARAMGNLRMLRSHILWQAGGAPLLSL